MARSPDDTSVFELALEDFKRSVEITRDVRFQANLRLSRRQRASSYIVSLLSLYVIALSLLPNIMSLQVFQSQILLACSIVLSVFVIFTSLIDGSQNFFHQGELLHQCARKIASIHHDLKLIDPSENLEKGRENLQNLQKVYQDALDECPINHENVDFFKELANKPHLFPDQYNDRWKWGFRKWNSLRALAIGNSWMILHICAFLGISYIVYSYILVGGSPISR